MRPREPRRIVFIPSRMKGDGSWMDICIHNASSRGLLVGTADPPSVGSYIDIRRGSRVVIGRVVWRDGSFFGVRCQGRLDIDSLIAKPRLGSPPGATKAMASEKRERRALDRASSLAAIARRHELSRLLASALQFAAIGLVAAAASFLLATAVHDALVAPFARVSAELAQLG